MESITESIWTKSKSLIKALIIGIIILILQIPAYYVRTLIEEREARQREAIAEVSRKWAGAQNIAGPVVVVPYVLNPADSAASAASRHYAYFLPDALQVESTLTPQEKHRGIYKVMLYTAGLNLSGSFDAIDPARLNIPSAAMRWNEAFVQFPLSDSRGLNEELRLNWKGRSLVLATNAEAQGTPGEGLTAPLGISGPEELRSVQFSTQFSISGSDQLLFTPIGKSTTVRLRSSWPHPSFTGDVLPQTTEVKDSGFTATWKSLSHKRAFPQQWKDGAYFFGSGAGSATAQPVSRSAFGSDLFVPVNGYQKTMRSVKYAALCILLTFAAFFLIETTNKRSVHPFQYGLIGLALVLFYTLLLSISEYTGFNTSYAIASVATIGLIAWFVRGVLQSGRLSLLLATVLTLVYTYVFTILQLQDYSLLLGSIGLFITLAVIMYFSRKIQW